MLQALALDSTTFSMPDGLTGHVRENMARGLPELPPAICAHDGTFVIVGSGPSLGETWPLLKEERSKGRPVCAINGAHDYLVEHGFEPDLFLTVDPRDLRHNVRKETENTVYLLASRCSPLLFDHLKDRRVMIWHAAGSKEEEQAAKECGVKMLLGGNSTSGLRAVVVAYTLGFRSVVMYGMDSCNAKDGVTKRVDGSLTGQSIDVHVGKTGLHFITNIAMAQQAQDFQHLWTIMPDLRLQIVGGGLLSAILDERKRLGMPT